MPAKPRNPFAPDDVDNDALGLSQTTERATWSLPGDEGLAGQAPAHLPPQTFDYSAGVFVGHDSEADAQPPSASLHLIGARTDAPHSYQPPHEATHRRYEAPFTVAVAQAAAGFTLLASARPGLHYVKLIAALLTADVSGTVKFVQGPNDGTGISASSGATDISGLVPVASNSGFVLPPSTLETPWFFTSPGQSLGLFSVTSKLSGFVTLVYSPYDS
jgi:hypothetical protein